MTAIDYQNLPKREANTEGYIFNGNAVCLNPEIVYDWKKQKGNQDSKHELKIMVAERGGQWAYAYEYHDDTNSASGGMAVAFGQYRPTFDSRKAAIEAACLEIAGIKGLVSVLKNAAKNVRNDQRFKQIHLFESLV